MTGYWVCTDNNFIRLKRSPWPTVRKEVCGGQVIYKADPPLELYNPEDAIVLQVLVADSNAVCRLWKALISNSQCRLLEFGNKALPSSTKDYSPFERQLLKSTWLY